MVAGGGRQAQVHVGVIGLGRLAVVVRQLVGDGPLVGDGLPLVGDGPLSLGDGPLLLFPSG